MERSDCRGLHLWSYPKIKMFYYSVKLTPVNQFVDCAPSVFPRAYFST